MPISELVLNRSRDGAGLIFTFPEGTHEATAIVIVDEEFDHRRVWAVASEALGSTPNPVTADEAVEELAMVTEFLAHGATANEITRARLARRVNRPLCIFEYGRVPPGFRQVLPSAGTPPPLQGGRRYSAIVVGGLGVPIGLLSFAA